MDWLERREHDMCRACGAGRVGGGCADYFFISFFSLVTRRAPAELRPLRRSSKRVEVWRKLQRYGAVALGGICRISGSGTDRGDSCQGVSAGAVGAIAGAALIFGRHSLVDVQTVVIAMVTFGLLSFKKVPEPVLILAAVAAGPLLLKG
jgi:hypothetical protein